MSYNDDNSYGRRDRRDQDDSYGRGQERREGGHHQRRDDKDSYGGGGREEERREGGHHQRRDEDDSYGGVREERSRGGGDREESCGGNRREDSHGGGRGEESYGGGGNRQQESLGGRGGSGGGGYGGGGSTGDNYYDSSKRYDDEQPSRQSGSGGSGRRPEGNNDRYESGGGHKETYGKESAGSSYGAGPTGTGYAGGGGSSDDYSSAASAAKQHAGNSGDNDLFGAVLGSLLGKKVQLQDEDVDEGDMVQQHKQMYGNTNIPSGPVSEKNMGAAAAMQALKMYLNSQGGGQSGGEGGAGTQNQFIGMAMGQAAQLYDQQNANGNVVCLASSCLNLEIDTDNVNKSGGASKESVVQQAAQVALKMYLKSETSGTGASGGGGGGGLLGMASKFLQ
ncbi:hypothetical protein EJ08DRAFT_144509 [Tothia fuscella]|uniref:DUF7721 domain-containing protein n=1 Tax=Tothia fuscella TaxID=1048955 RepID=A0A9P4U4X3_9PEZI|nr:hypothetical protein EJ08DRAFT_144509 [Tothia fuscella]